MTDLKIIEGFTPPIITFDEKTLQNAITEYTAKYQDLVFTENDISQAKADMAEINKVKTALDTRRKEIEKEISAPIKEFKQKIDAHLATLTDCRTDIENKINVFLEAEKQEKLEAVTALIEQIKQEKNVDCLIELDSKWLNKTTKLDYVRDCVETLIFKHQAEKQQAELLKMKKEAHRVKVDGIINKYATAYGFTLPTKSILDNDTQLSNLEALDEELDGTIIAMFDKEKAILEEKELLAKALEAEKAQKQAEAEAFNKDTQNLTPYITPITQEPVQEAVKEIEKNVTIKFYYTDTQKAELNAKIKEIQNLCNRFEIIN